MKTGTAIAGLIGLGAVGFIAYKLISKKKPAVGGSPAPADKQSKLAAAVNTGLELFDTVKSRLPKKKAKAVTSASFDSFADMGFDAFDEFSEASGARKAKKAARIARREKRKDARTDRKLVRKEATATRRATRKDARFQKKTAKKDARFQKRIAKKAEAIDETGTGYAEPTVDETETGYAEPTVDETQGYDEPVEETEDGETPALEEDTEFSGVNRHRRVYGATDNFSGREDLM